MTEDSEAVARRALGRFLRARRDALSPAMVGLDPGHRRRAPGLRREEVAQMCAISPTWYTWLEQGREISLSASALDRIATGLQLSATERSYVFELARRRDPAPRREDPSEAAPAGLARAIAVISAPAYVLDRLWCVRAWNSGAARLFGDWLERSAPSPNLLRFIFLEPAARSLIFDWEERARRVVAEVRADYRAGPEDQALRGLVEGLASQSGDFSRFWDAQAVLGRAGGARRFRHPRDGLLDFEQVSLALADQPEFKLVILLPPSGISSPSAP